MVIAGVVEEARGHAAPDAIECETAEFENWYLVHLCELVVPTKVVFLT